MLKDDSKLSDQQIRKLTLKQIESRLKTTTSHNEKRRLKDFQEQKHKENVRVYNFDLDEEKITDDEFLKQIREDKPISNPSSAAGSSGRPKLPNPNLRPRI